MSKRHWVWAFVALALFMVGLSSHGVAQTNGPRTPLSARYWDMKNPEVAAKAAKAAAARAARPSEAASVSRSKPAGAFLTYDVPGASKGTFPTAVSDSGFIAGYYNDANSLSHGFLRAPNGALFTFDVPGAVNGTFPAGINTEGAITGLYGDNVGSGFHSFIRAPNGTISTFDPPGATVFSNGTAINPEGTVTGVYEGASERIYHGYLRTRGGSFITIDAPGAAYIPVVFGTFPLNITAEGFILGVYSDAAYSSRENGVGYLMTPNGKFINITGPAGKIGQYDPYSSFYSDGQYSALSINPSGVIAGTYFEVQSGNPCGGNFRAFLRSLSGGYVTFDAEKNPPICYWTAPSGINFAGTVTGSVNDNFGIYHGFWRTPGGIVKTFDVPGAGTGNLQGTLPLGITTAGVIAGSYRDASNVIHGFLFRPY